MFDSDTDKKNIGLAKNLIHLRQTLDVYGLTRANWVAIRKGGLANNFFDFLATSCVVLITLDLCKIYEHEKRDKQKRAQYELNSIEGVLESLAAQNPAVLDTSRIDGFVQKYGDGRAGDCTLQALQRTVKDFIAKYREELESFKAFRNKWAAHSEFEFIPEDLPSYDVMEQLFDFGRDFYVLVSESFISVGPHNVNGDTGVKAGLARLLKGIGVKEVKREWCES